MWAVSKLRLVQVTEYYHGFERISQNRINYGKLQKLEI